MDWIEIGIETTDITKVNGDFVITVIVASSMMTTRRDLVPHHSQAVGTPPRKHRVRSHSACHAYLMKKVKSNPRNEG